MAGVENPATILVVDDDVSVRRLVGQVLANYFYRIIEAADGAEALEVAVAHDGPIHLLLTDIIMPKLNGFILAERLVKQRPETAVLFMSGYVEATLVSAKHPDAAFLKKPFRPDQLIEAVRGALGG